MHFGQINWLKRLWKIVLAITFFWEVVIMQTGNFFLKRANLIDICCCLFAKFSIHMLVEFIMKMPAHIKWYSAYVLNTNFLLNRLWWCFEGKERGNNKSRLWWRIQKFSRLCLADTGKRNVLWFEPMLYVLFLL